MTGAEAKMRFRGCFAATLTPFDQAGRLDTGAAQAHAAWLVEHGIQGLCPAGTTGEFLYLTEQEKRDSIRAVVAGAAGRVPVIAGVWALRPQEIAGLAAFAEAVGADGVFLPPPIYYPAGSDSIVRFYEAVRNATNLPVFGYNIPRYAVNEIPFDALERMINLGIVAGIKDSTGKTDRVVESIRRCGDRAAFFAASDSFASEGRRLGADGFISAIANVYPALFARLWAGDDALQPEVDRLRTALKRYGSIPALKYLLAREGFQFGSTRLPFAGLTDLQKSELDGLL
jgi:dihydrodipicolinate synthase/N-acetylneuraminate lyase